MQPHQLGEAYKSRDTRVDLQTVDKELWGRPLGFELFKCKGRLCRLEDSLGNMGRESETLI